MEASYQRNGIEDGFADQQAEMQKLANQSLGNDLWLLAS